MTLDLTKPLCFAAKVDLMWQHHYMRFKYLFGLCHLQHFRFACIVSHWLHTADLRSDAQGLHVRPAVLGLCHLLTTRSRSDLTVGTQNAAGLEPRSKPNANVRTSILNEKP